MPCFSEPEGFAVMAPGMQQREVSVYIGRFQIFHNGQLALLRRALDAAPRCLIVLGSAFQARSPKNPFTWQERAEMIKLAVPAADQERLLFLPVRDYYDQERWVNAVRQGVMELSGNCPASAILLVGHLKDATSDYLNNFPQWTLDATQAQGRIDGTALRDAYFGSTPSGIDAALAALVDQVPANTRAFLKAWSALPFFTQLADEWASLKQEKALWAGSPYPPVLVTVDAVVRCAGKVLLVERGRAPGKGLFAVPGGFIAQRETVYQSALRELVEETAIDLSQHDLRKAFKAVHVFDHPDRSLRGRVITHAHFFDLGTRPLPTLQAGDDAASAVWMSIDELAALENCFHEDHFHMLDYFFSLTLR